VLPYGISSGFVSITLPFVLVRSGFSVALAASIGAVGVSANLWRFLWGPVADLTLTARRWYLLGLGTSAATLFILAFIPLHQNAVAVLMTVVFISQVAATLIVLPVGGLMAHRMDAPFRSVARNRLHRPCPGSSSMDQSAKATPRVKRSSLIKQFSTAFLHQA
jgi:hypothetical protein